MSYEIDRAFRGSLSNNSKYKSYSRNFFAGVSAIAINVLAVGALAYFSPWNFSELKGDIPFSANNGSLDGYIRCRDRRREVVVFKNNKFISLEDALSDISKTTNNRKETIEDILKEINKYDCSK